MPICDSLKSYGKQAPNFMTTNNFSDTLVEEYDLFGKVFPHHDDLQNAIPNELGKHFSGNNGENLTFLDIGAGYGFTTKLVAKVFPKAKFIVNEYDAELISRADAYLADYNYEKQIGDIEEIIIQIPDASIDGVYTAWVIHNFPPEKREIIYQQISRVLKPGGVFVALEKVGNAGEQRTKDVAQAILDLEPFISKYNRPDLFLEWVKHDLRDEEPELLFSDDENEKYLKDNGLTWKYVMHILLVKVIVAIKQ